MLYGERLSQLVVEEQAVPNEDLFTDYVQLATIQDELQHLNQRIQLLARLDCHLQAV